MTNHMPLITVIVPVYNVSDYLDRTMETIVSQTYRNLEILLVDDGSTDSSGTLCDSWAERDQRIRVIHQNNQGPSAARNRALDQARGDYILFSDSDDLLSPELCQVLLERMTPQVSIAMCDIVHVFADRVCAFETLQETCVEGAADVIRSMWYQKGILPGVWAKLYRRSLFEDLRFTPGRIYEDVDLLHELFWAAGKIARTPSRLYGYVHREGSITTGAFSPRDLDILQVVDRLMEFAQDKPALQPAAQAYAVAAALRVYLNAPAQAEYAQGLQKAKDLLHRYGRQVCLDPNARTKTRCAALLYGLCRPLLRFAYRYTNRWKS